VSFPKQHIWWIMKDKEGTCTERQKPASLWWMGEITWSLFLYK
jgi:hypothetical protein